MSLLVTGAGGQVGRELAAGLGEGDRALTRAELDITDAGAVERLLASSRPSVVINAAGYTAVDRAETHSGAAFAVNLDGVAHLARACAAGGIAMLHLSTDYVFDGKATVAYRPDDPPHPLSAYGRSKYAGERVLRELAERYLILRVSWVFGAHGDNFVKTLLRLGAERDSLRVVADQVGGPTPAAAIAETLIALGRRVAAGEALPWGTYHYAGEPAVSRHAFAEAIFETAVATGRLPRAPQVEAATSEEFLTPARRPANACLDMAATTEALDLTPPDWRAGLRRMLEDGGV